LVNVKFKNPNILKIPIKGGQIMHVTTETQRHRGFFGKVFRSNLMHLTTEEERRGASHCAKAITAEN
jgi:hypothetical protein